MNGLGIGVYAAARANGGACMAMGSAKGGVGTTCVDDLLPSGISLNAADAAGWLLYGFAADGVVAVDVLVAGKALPATMLPNAYVADLGAFGLSDATAARRASRRRHGRHRRQRPASSRLVRPAGAGAAVPAPAVTRAGR